MVQERLDIHLQKKKKKNLDFILSTEIISKWIIGLHVKHKTIKFLEDIMGENLDGLGYGNNFLEYKSIWRDGIYWNFYVLSAQFCYDLKTALTKYNLLKREKNLRKPTDG